MRKDIRRVYKHSQSQLSNFSLKAFVRSSSESHTSSSIKLKTTYVPFSRDKYQNNSVFNSQNTIPNDATITNYDNIQSCKTKKLNYIISTISSPSDHS